MKTGKEKKRVIAYLHTHWDREWYREFEVFRLRLLRVFDNVVEMLEKEQIPAFYFDGQVCALLDYLKFRPEKEKNIRKLIKEKKLFIGPFYTLVDEFLTNGICFRKNLEIGLKISKDFGCEDFIGYFADTFGHSQNIPAILKEFNIDKAIVWRGVPDNLPAEFIFNNVNTVNLAHGYFMDIFSADKTIEEKSNFLKKNLGIIAEKSGSTILLPIGADHLGIPKDINIQIEQVNNLLNEYKIELSTPFEYFNSVKFKINHNNELRDNSNTFILPGCYSARTKLKQLNTECSYKLNLADKLQYKYGNNYANVIEYAYKLLLQNQAHDSICGCSTDQVHMENIVRYNKILQIANTIIEEIRFSQGKGVIVDFSRNNSYKILTTQSALIENGQIISKTQGFESDLLNDTQKIPITEDYKNIYESLQEINSDEEPSDLKICNNIIQNSNIKIEVENGKINLYDGKNIYRNFIEFVRYKDEGDTYNYAPSHNDNGEIARIKTADVIMEGHLRCGIKINTSFFNVYVYLNKKSKLLNFKIKWTNLMTNKLWQVKFNLPEEIKETWSEDMNTLIKREFDPWYNIRENLPQSKGFEAKTNTAPMQRFVWTNGFGVITNGLCEYEVSGCSLLITLLRSIGIISNPKNPVRTTPAGPPIKVPQAQQLGENYAEFAIGFFEKNEWEERIEEIFPQAIIL